jgi:hypothetical protein
MDAGRVARAQASSRPRPGSSWLRAAADAGGWINVPFTSLGDIDAQNEGWDTWKMHPENLLW